MRKENGERGNKSVEGEGVSCKGERVGGKDQCRVVISVEANGIVEKMVGIVNDGFSAGLITKSDVANYVFVNLEKYLNDSDFKNLRSIHFDDKKVLASILKNVDGENDLPEEIKKALREHYGITEKDKKRSLKQSQISPTSI